jgi:hypothetical protein
VPYDLREISLGLPHIPLDCCRKQSMHGGVLNGGRYGGGIYEQRGQALYRRDCIAVEQGFGSGEHRANV